MELFIRKEYFMKKRTKPKDELDEYRKRFYELVNYPKSSFMTQKVKCSNKMTGTTTGNKE
jgi:hypothetical protein